ncbi:MAG TPA: AI-2E family transporter [Polyangiales bacterium]|nr:AI-2E family transporter [Polyangiales bacterium]
MKDQARRTLILLIVLSLVLLWMTMRPLAEALFFACVLAGTLYPIHRRLRGWLRDRPQISAGILCATVLLALVAPFGGLAAFAVKESIDGVRFVAQTVQSEGVAGLLDELPAPVRKVADEVLRRFPVEEKDLDAAMQQQASAQGGKAARAVTGVLAATGSFMFQAALMTVALFFLLVDGMRLVSWLELVSPLEEGQTTELLIEFRRVTGAVLISSLATAGVQSLAAMAGYLITGVPHPVFFTTVTFFVSFIPAIGAGGMCLAAALILIAMGKTWMALFLAVWGVLVVGTVDNIIKPLLAKRGMHMHGAIVFFALIGGLTAFGTVGLLAGPLFVSFFLALVRIYQRDYGKNPQLIDSTGRSAAESGRGKKVIVTEDG